MIVPLVTALGRLAKAFLAIVMTFVVLCAMPFIYLAGVVYGWAAFAWARLCGEPLNDEFTYAPLRDKDRRP